MWKRRLKAGGSRNCLPHKGSAAEIGAAVERRERPINNRPQVNNLPHNGRAT